MRGTPLFSSVEQHLPDSTATMGGIDNDVVQDPRGPTQRHVVVSLDARIGVAEHVAESDGDEDDDIRVRELCAEERRVPLLGLRTGRDEALWVEVVVRADEQCAEFPDRREISWGCWSDGGWQSVHQRLVPRLTAAPSSS